MDKRIVGLVGVISGVASFDSALAVPNASELPTARSYPELLEPIPNALALLGAADVARASAGGVEPRSNGYPNVKVAQYYHHHHHYM